MGIGNRKSEGDKGSNYSYRLKHLKLLQNISGFVGLGATEATLQQVLSAIQDGQDFEAKIVVDDNGNGTTYLEVRIWNPDTQTWEAPLYYLPGSNTGVPAGSLTAPILYINNGAILSQIYTELLDQGVTQDNSLLQLQAVNTNTDQLEGLLTTIDTVLDNSLVQLQAINANTDQLEALSTDIKNLLTTIDTDTGNIANSLAALELCCAATNTLLTTIDGVLDQIQTNTLNTVNELTSANVTLAAVENELIALNNTAGTLATEATLELVRLQLVALNTTDFATEATVSTLATQATLAAQAADIATIEANIALLNAKFNTFGREPEATSTPFAIDQEAYNALLAIQTAVQNIDSDLGTGGLALETTQEASRLILVAIDNILAQIYTNLQLNTIETINIKNNTDAMVVDLAAIEVLITTTNSLLTTIDGVLDAIKLDTANLDVALSTRLSKVDFEARINTLGQKTMAASTPVVLASDQSPVPVSYPTGTNTPGYDLKGDVGTVSLGGQISVSVQNLGSTTITFNGQGIPPGVSVSWDAAEGKTLTGFTIASGGPGTLYAVATVF